VGIPIQKENETPFGPEAKGEENEEEISPPHPTLGSGRASCALPAESGAEFRPKIVLFIYYPQIASVDSR